MNQVFSILNVIVDGIKAIVTKLLSIVIPVMGLLIACDIIIGTKFGVFERLIGLVARVGITGTALTVIVVVGLVLWYNKKAA